MAILGLAVIIATVILVIGYIFRVITYWLLFQKAGEPGWKSLIPGYNFYTLYRLVWSTRAFWIWVVCVVVYAVLNNLSADGSAMSAVAGLVQLAAVIIDYISLYKLSKAFGHGVGFFLGLFFLQPIFLLILAFGSSQYVGNNEAA